MAPLHREAAQGGQMYLGRPDCLFLQALRAFGGSRCRVAHFMFGAIGLRTRTRTRTRKRSAAALASGAPWYVMIL